MRRSLIQPLDFFPLPVQPWKTWMLKKQQHKNQKVPIKQAKWFSLFLFVYLIWEEYPLCRVNFTGLDPRIAGEMHWTTCEPFNSNAFQIELLLVLVCNCDRTWVSKIRVHCELGYVIYPLCFEVWFLWPVLYHCLVAFLWSFSFCIKRKLLNHQSSSTFLQLGFNKNK